MTEEDLETRTLEQQRLGFEKKVIGQQWSTLSRDTLEEGDSLGYLTAIVDHTGSTLPEPGRVLELFLSGKIRDAYKRLGELIHSEDGKRYANIFFPETNPKYTPVL